MPDLAGDDAQPSTSQDIAPGSATSTGEQAQRWPNGAIALAVAAVAVVLVGITAIIGSTRTGGGDEIYGIWIVEEFAVDGETTAMADAGLNPDHNSTPYVEITREALTGDTGCNDFASQEPPEYSGSRLVVGEVWASAVGCLDIIEAPLLEAMWRTGEVTAIAGVDTMQWSTDTVELRFRRADRRPAPAIPGWPTKQARLDCSHSYIVGVDAPSTDGATAPSVLIALDGVVDVEGDGVLGSRDPFAWGLNADGVVIAGAAPGDIEPPVIHLSTCAEQFGLRPGADPADAVRVWVNDLGMGQPHHHVWSDRFVELCRSSVDDLPALAERYVHEDAETSLLPGGLLPGIEKAADALEAIQLSVCA